jgi:8-oxo-dGTP diphosphatase
MQNNSIRVGVGVIIKDGNKILLGKRAIDELAEGFKPQENNLRETWAMPGGKLEVGETLVECAKREIKEEVGIVLNDLKIVSISDDFEKTGNFLVVAFVSENFEGVPQTMEPNKIKEWQWFQLDQLPSPLFGPSEVSIKKFKEGILY